MMLKSAETGRLLISEEEEEPEFWGLDDDGGAALPVSKMMPLAAVPTEDVADVVGEPSCRLCLRVRDEIAFASSPRTTAFAAAILRDWPSKVTSAFWETQERPPVLKRESSTD